MPSYAFPPPPPSVEPTALTEADAVLARLAGAKAAWTKVSVDERIQILASLRDRTVAVAREWVQASLAAKGILPGTHTAGEEWLGGPAVTVRNIRLLEESLAEVRDHGAPRLPSQALSQRPDGKLVARVFPQTLHDRILFGGFHAEVWMQPDVTRENLKEHQAASYREPEQGGRVALVLGAGNVSSIPPMDALYKLFVENEVVVLKMNPVNEYLGPIFRKMFQDLVDRDVFEVVYGGAEVGSHLTHHPLVDTIHITGSDQTHDAIVWGPREGREERKARGEKDVDKPISSELGNVTPVIVVPGDWNEREMQFQAENVATMVANNASFNCNAAKLLVTARDWPLRDAFLEKVRAVLASTPPRKAYYPGAEARWQAFVEAHPDAEKLTEHHDETVPWTWIGGLDPQCEDEICFRQEPFCGVLHEVALPGKSAIEFLPRAVEFCNDKVWGTLACMILIHPATRKDSAAEAAFQEALDDLRYGGIGVNHWAGLVYGLVTTTWGAYPGHTLEDVQSGRGVVHNTYLFDKPEKSVVYGPFTMFPKPPWFVTHRRSHGVGEKMVRFEAEPSFLKLPGLVLDALRG